MKKSNQPLKMMALATALVIGATSCDELADLCNIQSEDLTIVESYNAHLNEAVFVYQLTDKVLRDGDLEANGGNTIDGVMCSTSGDSIIVDFGAGTVCADNKVRKGKILIFEPTDIMNPGALATATLSNYSVNDKSYTGDFSLLNTTVLGQSPNIDVTVNNFASGDENLNLAIGTEWLSGFETLNDHTDDSYKLTGQVTMTAAENAELAGNISFPVLINQSCTYLFEEGVIDLTPSNIDLPSISIDFIEGDCNNLFQAGVDCNGSSINFSYPIR